jgi:hypothetical protein
VLSPKTQTNLKNAKGYFEEHLSVGDYYAENERVGGEWVGEGAALLGLSGKVMRAEFLALCENQHPKSGEQLTQRRFDATVLTKLRIAACFTTSLSRRQSRCRSRRLLGTISASSARMPTP